MPHLPFELIDSLNKRYPLRMPHLKEEDRHIWFSAGQRSVVDFLVKVYERQNENILGV